MKYNNLLKAEILNKEPKDFRRGCREFAVNKRIMRFPCDVYSKIELKNKIIVGLDIDQLVELSIDFAYWRGVFCYDFEGNILWQVESPYYIDPDTKLKVICNNGEGAIQTVDYWQKESKVVVYGRMGYEVDPETGKLGDIVWHER